jgi:hypothetical protein
MARFIAVHPVAFTEDQLKPLATEPLPEGVVWHSTHAAAAHAKSFCHWEAPHRQAILDILARYSIPYEEVYEVRRFDPATGVMEAAPVMEEILQPA